MAGNDDAILLRLVATETGLDNLSKKTEALGSTLTKLNKSSIANLRQGLNELKKTVAESGEALKKMGEKASRNNKEMLFLG